MEARLAGEALQSDPVEHANKVEISTELAWEMSKKVLQQHKLQRTPIKLVVSAVIEAFILLLTIRQCDKGVDNSRTNGMGQHYTAW